MQDFLNTRPGSLTARSKPQFTELAAIEEPICVLRIELDGHRVEELKVFDGDDPEIVVEEFAARF